jgi:hypothetical protein
VTKDAKKNKIPMAVRRAKPKKHNGASREAAKLSAIFYVQLRSHPCLPKPRTKVNFCRELIPFADRLMHPILFCCEVLPVDSFRYVLIPRQKICDALSSTWPTLRRTYSSWAHDKGIPEKIVAELMGHSNVRTTLNIYTQVLQDPVRIAVNRIGEELFTIVHSGERAERLSS